MHRNIRLTRRGHILRMVAIVAGMAVAWQVAGYVADGAVAGIGGAPSAHAASVARLGSGMACATVDTGRNTITLGARRYRYVDTGDGIAWPAGMPVQARTLAVAGIDARRAAETVSRASVIRTCATWQDRGTA